MHTKFRYTARTSKQTNKHNKQTQRDRNKIIMYYTYIYIYKGIYTYMYTYAHTHCLLWKRVPGDACGEGMSSKPRTNSPDRSVFGDCQGEELTPKKDADGKRGAWAAQFGIGVEVFYCSGERRGRGKTRWRASSGGLEPGSVSTPQVQSTVGLSGATSGCQRHSIFLLSCGPKHHPTAQSGSQLPSFHEA